MKQGAPRTSVTVLRQYDTHPAEHRRRAWIARAGWFASIVGAVVLSVAPAVAQMTVPPDVSYQGRLLDASGQPLVGPVSIELRFFDVPLAGALLYRETHASVPLSDGVFSLLIGTGSAQQPAGGFGLALFSSANRWLELVVDGEVLAPRQAVSSVPFALRASDATSVGGSPLAQLVRQGQAGSISAGMLQNAAVTTSALAPAAVGTAAIQTNAVTAAKIADGPGSGLDADRLDGIDSSQLATQTQLAALQAQVTALQSQLVALQATLAGVTRSGSTLRFDGMNVQLTSGAGTTQATPNGLGNFIIGYNESDASTSGQRGGSHNLVLGPYNTYPSYGGLTAGQRNGANAPYAFVGGTFQSTVSAAYGSITGGRENVVTGEHAAVSGGRGNTASAFYSAVAGGNANQATAQYATVLAGRFNNAAQMYSSIAGGDSNLASGIGSAIAGGTLNLAGGQHSTVVGGGFNQATGEGSSISGGRCNTAGSGPARTGCNAPPGYSVVHGGFGNLASGSYSSVLGGDNNEARGGSSAVVAGLNNLASGAYALVATGVSNVASAYFGAVVSGANNVAGLGTPTTRALGAGEAPAIIAGSGNVATGAGAAVLGGRTLNVAGAYYSVVGDEGWEVVEAEDRRQGGIGLSNYGRYASCPQGKRLLTGGGNVIYDVIRGTLNNQGPGEARATMFALDFGTQPTPYGGQYPDGVGVAVQPEVDIPWNDTVAVEFGARALALCGPSGR